MEDVSCFGAADGLLHLTYTPPNARPDHLGITTATFRCPEAAHAYRELRAAAAERRLVGLGAPRDLGRGIPLAEATGRGGGELLAPYWVLNCKLACLLACLPAYPAPGLRGRDEALSRPVLHPCVCCSWPQEPWHGCQAPEPGGARGAGQRR